jgi:parallel beta-helix repeat protein
MKNNKISLIIIIILNLIIIFSGCTENQEECKVDEKKEPTDISTTITVGNTASSNYTKIQDAIDASYNEDTIIVQAGIYEETLIINTSINLIGEDLNNTIILSKESSEKDIIEGKEAKDERTNIDILTINNAYCRIENFTITTNDAGGIIRGITINSEFNIIKNCNITGLYHGIKLYSKSKNNTIINCIISNNNVGIDASASVNNTITDNYIHDNTNQGVYFYTGSDDNIFSKNIFIDNNQALRIKGSRYNQVYNNHFLKNSYGAYLCCAAKSNRVFNNTFIQNINGNAHEDKSLWNIWIAEFSNHGNYWDDYYGEDEDGDGIGDSHYIISESDKLDFYPLMNPPEVDYYFKDKITSKK